MPQVRSYRDLRVWQDGVELVVQIYRLTRHFPTEERYGLTSQTRRAALSIPANIAEGHGRHHLGEYLHHLSIANASLMELETHLEIASRLGYLDAAAAHGHRTTTRTLGRQLARLIASLKNLKPAT